MRGVRSVLFNRLVSGELMSILSPFQKGKKNTYPVTLSPIFSMTFPKIIMKSLYPLIPADAEFAPEPTV